MKSSIQLKRSKMKHEILISMALLRSAKACLNLVEVHEHANDDYMASRYLNEALWALQQQAYDSLTPEAYSELPDEIPFEILSFIGYKV